MTNEAVQSSSKRKLNFFRIFYNFKIKEIKVFSMQLVFAIEKFPEGNAKEKQLV